MLSMTAAGGFKQGSEERSAYRIEDRSLAAKRNNMMESNKTLKGAQSFVSR